MRVCSSLEEEHGYPSDTTQGFSASPDQMSRLGSHIPAALPRSSTSRQTSSQVKSTINVFCSCLPCSLETNTREQRFSNQADDDQIERKYSPLLCLTNTSPVPSFRTSRGSAIHILHPEDQSPRGSAMRNRVQTSDRANGQSSNILDTSTEATPARSRRQVCCWKSCGKKFTSQKDLSAHVNEDHVRFECPDADFKCHWEGCPRQGRGFNARYKMLIHIRTHTNEKPHMCVVCDKSFSRLENLKIHTRSHTGERPYSCTFPGCSKAYSNSSDRFKHIRTHQEQKPYKCKMPGCQKQYTDPSSLRKHVRTHRHAPDASRMELCHSLSTNTQINDVKMEVCSPSSDTTYDHDDLSSSRVYELSKYINTVRRLEKQDLTNDHFQTLHVIQNSTVESSFPNSGKDNGDITKDVCNSVFSDKDKLNTDRYRDVSGTPILIWQHQSMNSQVDIQKSCLFNSDRDQNTSFIKNEPKSSAPSHVSPHRNTCDEQLLKKEYTKEEHKTYLTCTKDDLHTGNDKSQTEFSTTECVSLLPTYDLSRSSSAVLHDLEKNDCRQEIKMSSSSLPPVLARSCYAKSPKLEHWKKRQLLISEQESQASIQLSSSFPTSHRPQPYGTSPISLHSTSSSESSLPSLVPPHISRFSTTTPNAPLINGRSPLSQSQLSSPSHCPVSPIPTCPRPTPTPAVELSPPRSLSSPCQTAVPSLYLLHHNHPLLYPLFTNSYSPVPTITNGVTPSSLYTHNSLSLAFSGNSLFPIPHYNSTVDHHFGVNRTFLLPSGPAFSHSEFHPPGVKHVWDPPGFTSLPLLMNVENTSLLSAASCHHFADSLRMMYQDTPPDLPPLYQSRDFRFPLYLGVNR